MGFFSKPISSQISGCCDILMSINEIKKNIYQLEWADESSAAALRTYFVKMAVHVKLLMMLI